MKKNKTFAIIGGGPGGLTLARLLQLKGVDVKVYERDFNQEVRVQGATLDLHQESGLKALCAAGLMDEFYANFRPGAGKLRVVDKDAIIKMDWDEEEGQEENRPEIDRGPLRNILLNSLAPGTVVWDSQYLSMVPYGNQWKISFKNGSSATADIVIAVDGANSRVRPLITAITPVYSGVTIVEGNVYHADKNAARLQKLLGGGKIFALGEGKSLILSAKGDGSISFYTGCKVEESWLQDSGVDFSDKSAVFDWFKTEFGSWNEIWQELFQGDEFFFVPRPQYHFPTDQQWTSLPNLTMIGDAAHRMPPYTGEGVNIAMLDALELSECLTNETFPTIAEAIAYFEKQMLSRASASTQSALASTEMLHSDDGLERLIQLFDDFSEPVKKDFAEPLKK
ncbi:FAD-dependent oxidoreductase [Pedobacter caeni]|uniref:Flavin-dependent monooxygenase n=1 Tax=Pedobacter caeni TaxID=288992 RepID=A0A1M4U9B7_9SPHI|nr:NAD(P)/FAD-dependent oxidoreductase [Pedobacter caeni]SHE53197.1 2-polyprenyl-6-methoxyphenol hydroxylase [Pedobacter caeni]